MTVWIMSIYMAVQFWDMCFFFVEICWWFLFSTVLKATIEASFRSPTGSIPLRNFVPELLVDYSKLAKNELFSFWNIIELQQLEIAERKNIYADRPFGVSMIDPQGCFSAQMSLFSSGVTFTNRGKVSVFRVFYEKNFFC